MFWKWLPAKSIIIRFPCQIFIKMSNIIQPNFDLFITEMDIVQINNLIATSFFENNSFINFEERQYRPTL